MKIAGQNIEPPKPLTIPVYRNGKSLGLLAGPVLTFREFEKLCPKPRPPVSIDVASKRRTKDMDDSQYIKNVEKWAERKTTWMMLKSLDATPGLTWETVQLNNPETWKNFESEMEGSFSTQEADTIINKVFEANMPSSMRESEASELFTDTSAEDTEVSNSLTDEQDSTPSGELVKDSESFHPA